MERNCFYNSFDIESYKLDEIFNLLSKNSDIITKKEELGLINKGIQKLFNKNIIYFECKYKSKKDILDEENPSNNFTQIYDQLMYSVLIVLTKDNRKFGAFINKNNAIINYNMNNNMNDNINNNKDKEKKKIVFLKY